MRILLVALVAALGCSKAPPAATPANQAPAPDYRATADDVLGFLPAQTDFVVGVDVVALRGSALWQKFEPQLLQALGAGLEKFRNTCGFDPLRTIERVTMAVTPLEGDRVKGVFVVRGVDTTKTLDCMTAEAKKEGTQVTNDRGVLIMTKKDKDPTMVGATVVGPSTLVVQLDDSVTYDSVTAVLAAGTPLRTSPTFMRLYERREPGSSLWMMANGNSKAFEQMAGMGMRPKSLDGSLTVTDRFALALRMTMGTPDEATRLAAELDKVKGPFGSMVERFDSRATANDVALDVVITEAQVRALLGMLGMGAAAGAAGPGAPLTTP